MTLLIDIIIPIFVCFWGKKSDIVDLPLSIHIPKKPYLDTKNAVEYHSLRK